METVLVTGGAGYVGSHIARRLAEEGYRVVILDNFSTGHRWVIGRLGGLKECVGGQLHFVEGDVSDVSLVRRLLNEFAVDAVIHCAARSLIGESVKDPGLYFAENVAKGIAFFNELVAGGVKYIVLSSTAAVYGIPKRIPIPEDYPTEPINPYGASKRMLEDVLRWLSESHSVRSITLRYFNAAGADLDGLLGEAHDPESHLIPLALRSILKPQEDRVAYLLGEGSRRGPVHDESPLHVYGSDYPTRDGTCVRDYVHVCDLADAHVVALEALKNGHPTDIWNVGTGEGYSVREVIDTVERVTGRSVPVMEVGRREGDPPILVAATKKLARLGWEPRYSSLEVIVRTAWRWHCIGFEEVENEKQRVM